jgi:glycosyltransferase involved in cell wall biosynthesis
MVGSSGVSTPPQALFVSYTSLFGGAERILLDHATALPGPLALACPEGPLAERARAAGIEVVPLRLRRMELRASARDRLAMPLRMGAQSREVRRIVAELRPGVVVAWSMRGLLSCAGALRGLRPRRPLVFHHNDLLPSPLVGRAVRAAARRADLVIALSQAIADDLDPDGRLGTPIEVVRPGVDLSRFRPAGPPPADPPTVLTLGAIVDWKRPDLALDAVRLAARELPGLRLRLAGEPIGEAGEALRAALARRLAEPPLAGRAELTGQIEDVPAALAGATCLLHCSDREPFGMALVEALACGRPVVAAAAAGPLEIIDASCGVLYPPGDPGAAARALADVVARAPELGRGARARAAAELDLDGSRERFRALVHRLVASR